MAIPNISQSEEDMLSGCLLCNELQNHSPLSIQLGICKNAGENVLLECDGFALITDISPLIPGHSLLVTKNHYSSFAQVPAANIDELYFFKQDCVRYITHEYSAPLLFEHGSGIKPLHSGACIYHAHLHILPTEAPVELWMRDYGDVRRMESILASRETTHCHYHDYIAYENIRGQAFIVDELEEPLPTQFIRRRLASHLRLENWHWKTVFSTLKDCQNILTSNCIQSSAKILD